jgi:hypothetical protein
MKIDAIPYSSINLFVNRHQQGGSAEKISAQHTLQNGTLKRTPSCSSNNILSLVERRKLIEAIILLRNLNCKCMRLKCDGHEHIGSGAGVGADDSACSQFQSDAGHRVTCSMILSCSE